MKRFIITVVLFIAIILAICFFPVVYWQKEKNAKILVEQIATMWDRGDRSAFVNHGMTIERDPWGNRITFDLQRVENDFVLTVRSDGPDGKTETDDDIIAKRSYPIGH